MPSTTYIHDRLLDSLGLTSSPPIDQWPFQLLTDRDRIQIYSSWFEEFIRLYPNVRRQVGIVTLLEQKNRTVTHNAFKHEYLEVVAYLNEDDGRGGGSGVGIVLDRSIDTDPCIGATAVLWPLSSPILSSLLPSALLETISDTASDIILTVLSIIGLGYGLDQFLKSPIFESQPFDRICTKEEAGFLGGNGNVTTTVVARLDMSTQPLPFRTLIRITKRTHDILGKYHPLGDNCYIFSDVIMKTIESLTEVEADRYYHHDDDHHPTLGLGIHDSLSSPGLLPGDGRCYGVRCPSMLKDASFIQTEMVGPLRSVYGDDLLDSHPMGS